MCPRYSTPFAQFRRLVSRETGRQGDVVHSMNLGVLGGSLHCVEEFLVRWGVVMISTVQICHHAGIRVILYILKAGVDGQ